MRLCILWIAEEKSEYPTNNLPPYQLIFLSLSPAVVDDTVVAAIAGSPVLHKHCSVHTVLISTEMGVLHLEGGG